MSCNAVGQRDDTDYWATTERPKPVWVVVSTNNTLPLCERCGIQMYAGMQYTCARQDCPCFAKAEW